jgi:flagellar biosynthesis/type III secretory pathway M-ring protein FliF/YscJ
VHSLFLALAATPNPTDSGTLRPGLTDDQITPGIWGFLSTAFIVVLMLLLIVDMVRRLRRVRYRSQVEEERAAGEAPEVREDADEVVADDASPSGPSVDASGDGTAPAEDSPQDQPSRSRGPKATR